MVQCGDAGAERDHQGAYLLRHVYSLLEERDQTGQHAGVGEAENGEGQMSDPERILDEEINHKVCNDHHRDVQVDHLAGARFHRDEDVHEPTQAIGEVDDRGHVGSGRFGQRQAGLQQKMLRIVHGVRFEAQLKCTAAQEQYGNQIIEAPWNGRIF